MREEVLRYESVLYQMSILQRRIFRIIHDRVFKKYSIHPGQIPMLFVISKRPGTIQREIANIMDLEPGTVAVMLKRMEKNGLVQRKADDKDRRILKVQLTPKAQEILEIVQAILKELEGELMNSLSKDEQNTLILILNKLRACLDKKFDEKDEKDEACNFIKLEMREGMEDKKESDKKC